MALNRELLIISAAFLILFIMLIICLCIALSNRKKLKRLIRDAKKGSLIDKIEEYYNKVDNTANEIRAAAKVFDKVEKDCANALGQVAIVNFDAFDNLRGNFSFCVALLNQHNDGFVITSLYGNDSCNTYVKKIKNGEASVQLMDEEKDAVRKALYTYE